MKKSASKELTLHEFDKFVHDITNTRVAKEQMSFTIENQNVYFATSN